MVSRKKKTTVQALEEPMHVASEILTINQQPPAVEPIIEALNKGKLQALISKFPNYPNISDRHPQKIEDFLNAYTQTLKELQQAIAEIP
jgi:hypothetical protein